MKKLVLLLVALCTAALFIVGCGSDKKEGVVSGADNKEITVGVTAGPHEEVMDFVAKEAKKQGINVKVVPFNDYVQPNVALANKELNMNSYQHQPYLDAMNKTRDMHLVSIGKTILLPMGMYSDKIKDLKNVPDGIEVAIPNDPTNGGRALLLLQSAGLIKLKDNIGVKATIGDVVDNPHHIKFKELDAAQISRSMHDVDLACVNTNYALNAGLNPQKDALFVESKDSPYANVMAVREADKSNPQYLKVLSIYQSEPVKAFIIDHFKGSILPAF